MENQKKKMMNLELLRCVAMMMVIVLHYLGKGDLLPSMSSQTLDGTGITAWIMESLSVVAVNVYMLISGYLLCESGFKWNRFVKLLLQLWFYSVVFGLLGVVLGTASEPFTLYYLLQLIFPVFMEHYWFMTAYVFLYMMLPFLGMALAKMTRAQHKSVMLLFVAAFSVLKSVLPVRLTMDKKGYDVLWYLTVFLVAAYVRKYGMPAFAKKSRAIMLYLGGVVAMFGGLMVYRMIYLKFDRLDSLLQVFMEYNHIFCLLAALGLFLLFLQFEVKGILGKLAGFAGPLTLGIYLLHENLGFRYAWQKWLFADKVTGPVDLILYTLAAVTVVFTAGILIEFLRGLCMKPISKWIDKKLGKQG